MQNQQTQHRLSPVVLQRPCTLHHQERQPRPTAVLYVCHRPWIGFN